MMVSSTGFATATTVNAIDSIAKSSMSCYVSIDAARLKTNRDMRYVKFISPVQCFNRPLIFAYRF